MIKMHVTVNFEEASMIETALMELIKVVKTRPSPEHIAKLEELLFEVAKKTTKLYEYRRKDDE